MSQEQPLTSREILDKAEGLVNGLRTNAGLSNSEIIMLLDTAKIMQVQQVTIDCCKQKQ